nr:hypothetical protein [Nanoarchaeota archaeon]
MINANIELTDLCNMQCIMCDQNYRNKQVHNTKPVFFSFENWKKVLNDLKKFNEPIMITPSWAGESLLHPQFNEFMSYAFEQNNNNIIFDDFRFNTNASLLDKETTHIILECANMKNQRKGTFKMIHFSIDAVKRETYKRIKGQDLYEQTLSNILCFIKQREQNNFEYPKITVAMVVMDKNKNEAKEFVEFWKKIFNNPEICYDWPSGERDAIYFRKLSCADYKYAKKIHKETVTGLGLLKKDESKGCILKDDAW